MSQRYSGYECKKRDSYETPEWVTAALIPHLPTGNCTIWAPTAGAGKITAALLQAGFDVIASDINDGRDFLIQSAPPALRTCD